MGKLQGRTGNHADVMPADATPTFSSGDQALITHVATMPSSSSDAEGAPAASVPAKAVQIAGTDGTNLSVPDVVPADATPVLPGRNAILVRDVSGGGAGPNASVGTVGAASPSSATLVAGTDGTNLIAQKIRANGAMRVESIPYIWDIGKGAIPGHSITHKHVSVTMATLARQLAVAGIWAEQLTGAQRSLVSDSAADAVGGGGTEKVRIEYINTAGAAASETVTLTGTTPVNTVATDIKWINAIEMIQGVAAVGTISMYSGIAGGGVVMAQILPGMLELMVGVYYVPTGKTASVFSLTVSTDDEGIYELVVYEDRTADGGGASIPHVWFAHYVKDKGGSSVDVPPATIDGGQKYELHFTPADFGKTHHFMVFGWVE